MKNNILQWIMTNLCAWICIEENPCLRQAYLDLFNDLYEQTLR